MLANETEAVGQRCAQWLAANFSRHASKMLQARLGVSDRTADRVLAGDLSGQNFFKLVRAFGKPFADFVLAPVAGTLCGGDVAPYCEYLERLEHDAKHAAAAASVARRALVEPVSAAAGAPAGLARRAEGACRREAGPGRRTPDQCRPRDDGAVPSTALGDAARRLLALSATVEQHDISADSLDPRHAELIKAAEAAEGYLSPAVIQLLDRLGLAEKASLYTADGRVIQLGPDSVFWTAEERAAADGRGARRCGRARSAQHRRPGQSLRALLRHHHPGGAQPPSGHGPGRLSRHRECRLGSSRSPFPRIRPGAGLRCHREGLMSDSTYEIVAGHGHTEAECDALRMLDRSDRAWMAMHGLEMSISHDFAALKAENATLREFGCGPLVPIYDDAYGAIDGSNGAWVVARDAAGNAIGLSVARLREVKDLKGSLEDGTFLFGPERPEGAKFRSQITGLDGVTGPVIFIGGLFIHPKHRGTRLSSALGGALMRNCWYRWSVEMVVAFMAPRDVFFGLWFHNFNTVAGKVWFTDPRWRGLPRYNVLTATQTEIRQWHLAADADDAEPVGAAS